MDAYYRNEGEAEADAAIKATGVVLNGGVVEDMGFWLRYQELLKGRGI